MGRVTYDEWLHKVRGQGSKVKGQRSIAKRHRKKNMRTLSGCNLPKMLDQLPQDERLDWHETFALCGLAYTTQRFAERHGLKVPARLAKRLMRA